MSEHNDSRDPRVNREAVASMIAAREHADVIVDEIRRKLYRYIDLEVLATQQDDHTKSLSDRVTIIEQRFGELLFDQR